MRWKNHTFRWKRNGIVIIFVVFVLVICILINKENIRKRLDTVILASIQKSRFTSSTDRSSKKIVRTNQEKKNSIIRSKSQIRAYPKKFPTKGKYSVGLSSDDLDAELRYEFADRKRNIPETIKEVDNDRSKTLIQDLVGDLQYKTQNVFPRDNLKVPIACNDKKLLRISCDKTGCLQLQLPEDPKIRLKQLVLPPYLHPSDKYTKVLKSMRNVAPDFYDIIFVTASSSNHYEESKALLYNLRENVFPYVKNFTFIYYDIGLSKEERRDISKICQCKLVNFPFSSFPEFASHLKCYVWKPLIINAHASNCNLLYWFDASIRFKEDPSKLKELLRLARVRGMQSGSTRNNPPRVTLATMFHFFGDEPCVYHSYTQATASHIIFHNERLIRNAILIPWAACALNETCMCPQKNVDLAEIIHCRNLTTDAYQYGVCHRFDQSALSILTRKVFKEKSHHILKSDFQKFLSIKRGDKWEDRK